MADVPHASLPHASSFDYAERFTIYDPKRTSGDRSAYILFSEIITAAAVGLFSFKGNTDCSGNPNYPSALKGDAYRVSVAGKIGGASGTAVEVGDFFVAIADNAGGTQAGVGANWSVWQNNLPAFTTVGANLTTLANPSAIRFIRIKADNSVEAISSAAFIAALGVGSQFVMTSTPAAITSTSETDFNTTTAGFTVPALTAAVKDVFTLKMAGFYSGTVLPTIRGKNYFGSTVVADTGTISGLVTGTNLPWRGEIRATVRAIGATGTLQVEGWLTFSTAATAALSILIGSASYTIDFTVDNLIKMSIQWGAGGTGQTITLDDFDISKGGPLA